MSQAVPRTIVTSRVFMITGAGVWLFTAGLTSLGCRESVGPNSTGAHADSRRPNILLIVADDMGYTDVGFMGGEIATPNLDALALGGLRFTNFHAGPSCGPTRAMLMSGRTNRDVGVTGAEATLAPEITTLPEMLQQAGYHTYMAGKWHIGQAPEEGPAGQGFDSSYALVRAGDNHLGASNYPPDSVAYRDDGEPAQLPEDWFSTQLYTDRLLASIRANEGDGIPWFAYLAFTAPHWPLQLPEAWLDRYAGQYEEGYDAVRDARVARAAAMGLWPEGLSAAAFEPAAAPWESLDPDARRLSARSMELYAAMVENLDEHIGRVISYLESSGQLDDTVIVFMSDNGASGSDETFRPTTMPRTDWDSSLPNMGRAGSFVAIGRGWAEAATAPFRDVKGSLHQGGTLVAAFVASRLVARPGALDRAYVTVMDVLPTLVEIADPGREDAYREAHRLRGRSFWGRVLGEEEAVHDASDVTPWGVGPNRAALVRGEWKILREPGWQGTSPDDELRGWKLFNLARDPGETTDLSTQEPDLTRDLLARWHQEVDGS